MQTFEILNLDTWGNSIDGFNVNQAFYSGNFLSLSEDANNAEIFEALRAADLIHDHVFEFVDELTM